MTVTLETITVLSTPYFHSALTRTLSPTNDGHTGHSHTLLWQLWHWCSETANRLPSTSQWKEHSSMYWFHISTTSTGASNKLTLQATRQAKRKCPITHYVMYLHSTIMQNSHRRNLQDKDPHYLHPGPSILSDFIFHWGRDGAAATVAKQKQQAVKPHHKRHSRDPGNMSLVTKVSCMWCC